MTAFDAALAYLGWQGGTIHDMKRELNRRDEALCQKYSETENDMTEVACNAMLEEIATIQTLLRDLQ